MSQKQGLLLSVSSSSSILHGAGGGNEKVMRLFLPPPPCALLEKTDEPELANKVKTIRGEDAHACTHTTHKKKKKRDVLVYSWKIDCVNIHFISAEQYVSCLISSFTLGPWGTRWRLCWWLKLVHFREFDPHLIAVIITGLVKIECHKMSNKIFHAAEPTHYVDFRHRSRL